MPEFGLELRDDSQNIVLSPKTFTVRVVDAVMVSLGKMTVGQRTSIPVSPEVTEDMFAAVEPLYQYTDGQALIESTGYWGPPQPLFLAKQPIYHLPSTPWVEVHNGTIEVCASDIPISRIDASNYGIPVFYSGQTLGDIVVYILTYN